MKFVLFFLFPCILYASSLTVQYQQNAYVNDLAGIYTSSDQVYEIYDFAPAYTSNAMVDVFDNTTNNTYYDPSPSIHKLGCNRKLHITNDGRLYCTDDNTQNLLSISTEPPFTVLDSFYLGFPNKNYDDWLDPQTQYLVFVELNHIPDLYNFTIFNTSNNQFLAPIIVNATELVASGYGTEGYFIASDFIGFGIEDMGYERPTEIWQYTFSNEQMTQISTNNITDIHRIIILNYANVIYIHENTIFTTEVSSGQYTSIALDTTISDINKINATHFAVATADSISLFTVDQDTNQLAQVANVDLSSYLQITGVTLTPPDCCVEQGYLQVWVQKPQQNSYFLLDPNTLQVIDYQTPYQVGNKTAPYFPSFFLGNGTLVSPMYDGYRLGDSSGKFLGFVPVPLQDVYYDPSNDLVYGFFTGATEDYPSVTTCYLLAIQRSESNFTTINLPQCPNPTQNSTLSLLDVQCDSNWNCNLVYQTIDDIYVISGNTTYTISNKLAQFGDIIAFAQYSTDQLYLVHVVQDVGSAMGQVVVEWFDFVSGNTATPTVLSLYGTASKIDADTVMFTYSYLLQTLVHVYNVSSASYISNTTIAESLVSSLISLNGGQSFVTMAPSKAVNLYQVNGQQVSVDPVNYNSMGSAFVEQTGPNSFVVTSYNVGMQNTVVYSFGGQALIEK